MNIKVLPLSPDSILISWLPPLHPSGQLTGYCLHIKTMIGGQPVADRHEVLLYCTVLYDIPCGWMQVYPSSLEYTVSSLLAEQPYSFWVTATTAVGEGAASAVVTESPRHDGVVVPAMISSFSLDLSVARGDRVSLPCRAIGNPVPGRQWMFK